MSETELTLVEIKLFRCFCRSGREHETLLRGLTAYHLCCLLNFSYRTARFRFQGLVHFPK